MFFRLQQMYTITLSIQTTIQTFHLFQSSRIPLTPIAAIFHRFPVALPLLAPCKWTSARYTYLARQMLLLYPLHSLSPPSFFLLLRDLGVTDVLGALGTFGALGALGILGDLAFAGRLCFFKTLAFSSLANFDFRIS